MSPAELIFLIIVICVAVIGLIVGLPTLLAFLGNNTRSNRSELREARALIHRIEKLALSNSDVNPELSYQIRDEIRNSEMKELS